jgi:putative membrane protein
MRKPNYVLVMLFVSMLLSGISACNKDDDNKYVMTDQDFVTRASSSNMLEIAAGQLAINQGEDAGVKAFGQHMVNDHGQTATEMSALATKKGWTVPTTMLTEHQQMYDSMKSLTGTAFDKQFAAIMVTSHQKTIELFDQAARDNGVSDVDLRAFAAGKLPALNEHLQDAIQLQVSVNQ